MCPRTREAGQDLKIGSVPRPQACSKSTRNSLEDDEIAQSGSFRTASPDYDFQMIRLLEATIRPLRTHSLVLTERIRHRVAYNPFADAITQDPYPTYAALRARSPVHRSLLTHAWVLTRYADVDAVLRDHRRFSNDPRRREAAHRGIGALPAGPDDYSRLLLDPPEHTRLRRLVNEAFTPLAIEALEPRIRTITAELLERVATPTSFDLVRDVAQPLPLRVIMWMLGVPPESFRRFEVWSKQRARLLELTVSARERAGARAAGRGMDAQRSPHFAI